MDIFLTSHLRANCIAWLPVKASDRVGYIGDGEDVIAEKLRELSEHVTCAAAAKELLAQGSYDYVISLGGVTEEISDSYACLAETGTLVFAAENAYGLKYLAGTKEISSGEYFASVEAAEGSRGYTKEELLWAIREAGYSWQRFYYPFPDYQFTMSVYSDDYLPKQGELIDQIGNFDRERLVLFDESRAADALIARGKFREFSNSYLIVAGKTDVAQMENERGETISYVKFSNDRGFSRNIRTYITKSKDGAAHLLKTADCAKARPQIEKMKKTYHSLRELYADTKLSINTYMEWDKGAEFAFLSGHTMEEELDAYVERGEYEKATDRMFEVLKEICACKGVCEFQMTEEFKETFGSPKLPEGLIAAPASDIDMIMPNILVGEDGSWTVIDYEWSFHFPIPLHFIVYRAIRYYADTTAARRAMNAERLYEKAGISREEVAAYDAMEEAFQSYVLDSHVPMRERYKQEGKPAYHVTSVLHVVDELERRRALQIYFDRGAGFSEEDTATYRSKALDGTYRLEIPVGSDVKKLRIDPGSQACTVEIKRLAFKGGREPVADFISNGHKLTGSLYLFDTDDPNILLQDFAPGDKTLILDLRIDSMSLAAAEWIAPKIDAKYRLKKMLGK